MLNLAGMAAFIVAFVPTAMVEGRCGEQGPWAKWDAAITNNVWAVVVALVFARLAVWVLYRSTHTGRRRSLGGEVTVWTLRFLAVVGMIGFVFFRDLFDAQAHNVAAVLMFVAIIATVCVTAFLVHRQPPTSQVPHPGRYLRLYQAIAALMLITLALVMGVRLAVTGWSQWVLVLEGLLIAEFAAYWVAQTIELWTTPNRVALIPERLRSQLAHQREVRGPGGLVTEVRQLRQLPSDERMCRVL